MPYEILSNLGSGAFGKVYRFRHSNDDEYALKVIKLGYVTFDDVKVEGSTMMNLSHPHIIQCCNCSQIDTDTACLLLEFCGRGTLTMEIQRVAIDESRAIQWFAQMADALKYLHSQHVMHRDLKPDNILLTSYGIIKIGDLGIAKILEFTAQSAGTMAGTKCYMSPQVLNNERYNNKTDIWSLGCIFHEVFHRKATFHYLNLGAIINGPTPALPNHVSEKMKRFIMQVLERVEQNRPTAQEIFDNLNKSFLNGEYSTATYTILDKVSLDKTELKNALKGYQGLKVTQETQKGWGWGCC